MKSRDGDLRQTGAEAFVPTLLKVCCLQQPCLCILEGRGSWLSPATLSSLSSHRDGANAVSLASSRSPGAFKTTDTTAATYCGAIRLLQFVPVSAQMDQLCLFPPQALVAQKKKSQWFCLFVFFKKGTLCVGSINI